MPNELSELEDDVAGITEESTEETTGDFVPVPEVSEQEWLELCNTDSRKLTPTQVLQRDRPFLRKAQNGDAEAWTQIWHYYEVAIIKKIREFFWDVDDIFDVAQAIYIRGFEKIHTYNPEKKFYPWIHMVIRNFSLNALKHDSIVKFVHVGAVSEHDMYELKDEVGVEPCLEDHKVISARDTTIKDEECDNLHRCIEHLTPNHRQIIEMKHFKEMSYKEIAAKLNIPIGTVMSRLFNARQELADIWNDIIDDIPNRKK